MSKTTTTTTMARLPVLEESYKKAQARIQRIQSHLTRTPRGSKLKDKVCIITGVGSLKGIGRATSILFAHEGAKHLYLMDFSEENLPNLQKTIETSYPDVRVTAIQADAADDAAISGVCEQALREEGRLDVFFANAGISSWKFLPDITADDFTEMMRVNALSVFLAIKYASKAMGVTNPTQGKHESEGSIILTASVAGLRSGAGSIDYSASKAAVNNMVQTSVFQLQRTNIRINSICPGLIETGMTDLMFSKSRERGSDLKIGQLNALGRYGVPEEIAQVALFLASDSSSYVNGQNWAVDGGLSASLPTVPGKLA